MPTAAVGYFHPIWDKKSTKIIVYYCPMAATVYL